ncbi:hypothetical protein [uncultured Methanobrevibacter sp.]|uniref:hypothetical protein n=1 Tax=uncultured Methanobrevibacter sp. TaxID=253161 RepID=UPI0025E08797|nr:hypothetical protein [uncultured Methanobrevibacter sp.]
MISEECKNCEMLDMENKKYPCKLDNILRCNILYRFVKREEWKMGAMTSTDNW